MAPFRAAPDSNVLKEPKWNRMLLLSVFFHLILFSLILFVPESIPTRRLGSPVYEVDLVDAPSKAGATVQKQRTPEKADPGPLVQKQAPPTKLIQESKTSGKTPVVIGKKTVKPKKKKAKKKKTTRPSPLRQALKKLERKVERRNKDPLGEALSKLKKEVKGSESGGAGPGLAPMGFAMRMYQVEVKDKISDNWSYPVALGDAKGQKDLEAIVVVRVEKKGTILKTWFKKRSSNAVFDESVIRAVERSDPLPPFPEGYRRSFEEIVINFNLSDLEGN